MFDSPVFVKSGESLIQEIACLEDALEFLYEWPKDRRDAIYEAALRGCQRAFDGGYPLSSAREAFRGFAKSANIHERLGSDVTLDGRQPWPWRDARLGHRG
jgi:hypothetical protein